jgi:hypothetical protein
LKIRPKRDNPNAPEGADIEQGAIAGNDNHAASFIRALENPIIVAAPRFYPPLPVLV